MGYGTLEILSCSTPYMWRYVGNMKKYVENTKKYMENVMNNPVTEHTKISKDYFATPTKNITRITIFFSTYLLFFLFSYQLTMSNRKKF